MRPAFLFSVLIGASVGTAGVWVVSHRPAPPVSASVSSPPAAVIAPSGPLSPRQTSLLIAAWLALPTTPGPRANHAARAESLRAVLARLADTDFPRLLDGIQHLFDEAHSDLRRLAFDAWLDRDPASAARWAISAGKDAGNLAIQAARAWSRRDALAALAFTSSLADQDFAINLTSYVTGQIAPADLARALAIIEARGASFRDALAADLFRPMAKTDPAAAIRAFGPTMWRRGTQKWQLDTALAAWARTDLDGALAWLAVQPRAQELPSIAARLGTDDASRARVGSALLARTDFPMRQATLGKLLSDWVEKSPSAALAWLDTIADRDLRNRILERATRGYSPEHPEQDLPLVLARVPSQSRDETLGMRLEAWAVLSPEATLAWLAARTDDPVVARAAPRVHGAILGALAVESPEAAVREWKNLADAASREAAIGPIVQSWARTDPASALRWGTEQLLVAGQVTANWQSQPLQIWAKQNPAAVRHWLQGQTNAQLERSLLGFDGGIGRHLPPASAADLYAQIRNPEIRAELITKHLRDWLAEDPSAARMWLENHDTLTPEQTAALLQAR